MRMMTFGGKAERAIVRIRNVVGISARTTCRGLYPGSEPWQSVNATLSSGVFQIDVPHHEAGQPVNVLLPIDNLVESTAYDDCPIQVEGPCAVLKRVRKWPCLPCYNADRTAEFLKCRK